jgi:hypothetical protein
MTDARIPERWLNDRRLLLLSDAAFRLHITGLVWAVSNRTEGVIDEADLPLVPRVDPGLTAELEKVGLWEREGSGWVLVEFDNTQTSRAQLEGLDHRRKQDRERAKRYRDNRKTPSDSSRDSSRDDKGQARPGQASTVGKAKSNSRSNLSTDVGERDSQHKDVEEAWPTTAVPGEGFSSSQTEAKPPEFAIFNRGNAGNLAAQTDQAALERV